MPESSFISIDQNSNPLWDTVPKLAALARRGLAGLHCVEDIDVAFTRQGVAPEAGPQFGLMPECLYRTGNSDWGAALFYTCFLGRNILNPRELEPFTGLSTAALARRLELSVDGVFSRFAGSDNWQLVGSSYAGDPRRHRIIGDVSVAESAPFVRELLDRARRDLLDAFPEAAAQRRIGDWFAAEAATLDALLTGHAAAPLVRLYQAWIRRHVPDAVRVGLTSDVFAAAESELPRNRLLAACIARYPEWVRQYNAAVEETACGLKPLAAGELPFFAVWREASGRLFRTGLNLDDGRLVAGDRDWPLDAGGAPPFAALRRAGLVCVAGKALLLVLQARLEPGGAALALPHLGSLYMPAARAFEAKLRAAGLVAWPVRPVLRVRFRFLERLHGCPTLIRLPEWLRGGGFSADELPAARFADELPEVLRRAAADLELLRTPQGREAALRRLLPAESGRAEELERRRRELARDPATRAQAGAVWDELRGLETKRLTALAEFAHRLLHVCNLTYWDSRGALLPWSIALGGPAFYDRLLAEAEFIEE